MGSRLGPQPTRRLPGLGVMGSRPHCQQGRLTAWPRHEAFSWPPGSWPSQECGQRPQAVPEEVARGTQTQWVLFSSGEATTTHQQAASPKPLSTEPPPHPCPSTAGGHGPKSTQPEGPRHHPGSGGSRVGCLNPTDPRKLARLPWTRALPHPTGMCTHTCTHTQARTHACVHTHTPSSGRLSVSSRQAALLPHFQRYRPSLRPPPPAAPAGSPPPKAHSLCSGPQQGMTAAFLLAPRSPRRARQMADTPPVPTPAARVQPPGPRCSSGATKVEGSRAHRLLPEQVKGHPSQQGRGRPRPEQKSPAQGQRGPLLCRGLESRSQGTPGSGVGPAPWQPGTAPQAG